MVVVVVMVVMVPNAQAKRLVMVDDMPRPVSRLTMS